MTLIRRTGSFIALVLLLGCSSDSMLLPKQGLRFEFAQWTCGPADGGAMLIFLTRDPSDGPPPSTPYVSIYVDLATTNLLDGRQLSVAGEHGDAFARYNRTDTDYEIASAGYVTANFSVSDQEIVGVADITFSGAGHLMREFSAHVFPNGGLCN